MVKASKLVHAEFDRLVRAAGLDLPQSGIQFLGGDPVFPSAMCLATGMGSAMGMVGSAIDDIWAAQSGRRQEIAIDLTYAALFMSSMWLLRINGEPATESDDLGPLPAEGIFRCADGRWLSISCVFPPLTEGTLEVLDCAADPDAVRQAISKWNSFELEQALTERDLSGVVIRSHDEWLAQPPGSLDAGYSRRRN